MKEKLDKLKELAEEMAGCIHDCSLDYDETVDYITKILMDINDKN